MEALLRVVDAGCDAVVWGLLRLAVAVEDWRRAVRRRAMAFRASLRRILRRWARHRGREAGDEDAGGGFRRRAWNRTPRAIEEEVVALHVEYPHLGAGQLSALSRRVLGFTSARETVRRILLRRQGLVVELEEARRRVRRRIRVKRALELWGADVTLVWLLGFWPAWVLGVVDYHGSRVVALERLKWPTSAEVVRVLGEAFQREGRPERLLTDNGSVFVSEVTESFLGAAGVRHSRIRPGHAWTNGRIERVFRTFKSTVFSFIWLFASLREVDGHCRDFVQYYNRDRPHSAWGLRTPDEVYFERTPVLRPLGEVAYFGGRLRWFRFGFG